MLRALRQFCMLYRKLPIENVHVPCINSENKKKQTMIEIRIADEVRDEKQGERN